MNLNKKAAALLLAGCLCFSTLTACGNPADGDTLTDNATTTESHSELPTETETETEMNTETETDTETEPATDTEPPQPQYSPIVEENGKDALQGIAPAPADTYIDPLTGTAVSREEAERRPVAIMLNNVTAALPQQNIGAADILYECQVEGYLTRLMGVYNQYEDLVAIGSVRSSREYYLDFAANHDAIYVHAGGSDSAYRDLKARKTHNVDAVNDYVVSGYFYRDPNRLATMRYEHTLVIDGDRLNAAIAAKKYRITYASTFESPLQFVGEDQQISLTDGSRAKELTVKFGAHTTLLVYDAASNRYLRWQNGQKHVDGVTNEQLGFENVILLYCPYSQTNDALGHITVASTGSGTGYYFTGGKYMEIRWSKASGDAPLHLTYPSGKALTLTPGKTNFEIVGYASAVTITEE